MSIQRTQTSGRIMIERSEPKTIRIEDKNHGAFR
jgi:hypothetical protein